MNPKIVMTGTVFFKPAVHGLIGFRFDRNLEPVVRQNIVAMGEGALEAWTRLEVRRPAKPISRGPRSQMNWIHGQCSSIADQLNLTGSDYTPEDIKIAMKRMASTDRGYPLTMGIDGVMQPISLAQASQENAGAVIDTILDFAFLNELAIVEYDAKGKPVRLVRGVDIRKQNKDTF